MWFLFKEKSKVYRIYVKREKERSDVADVKLVPEGADISALFLQLLWPLLKGMPIIAVVVFLVTMAVMVLSGKALIASGETSGLGLFVAFYFCVIAFLSAFAEDLQGFSLKFNGYAYGGVTYGASKAAAFERALAHSLIDSPGKTVESSEE